MTEKGASTTLAPLYSIAELLMRAVLQATDPAEAMYHHVQCVGDWLLVGGQR